MSSTEDSPSDGFQSIVREARVQMQEARSLYYQDRISDGPVSRRTRERLCAAARNYYDVMLEFRDKNQQIAKAWQENSDVDLIGRLAAQKTTVEVPSAGRSAAAEQRTQNALLSLDPDRLINLTKDLDYFANELGFGSEVNTSRPKGRIGPEERYE